VEVINVVVRGAIRAQLDSKGSVLSVCTQAGYDYCLLLRVIKHIGSSLRKLPNG
jgi:hypothetical protein